jgi:hypothetical protein
MITKRDKNIIKFIEVHGSITINQCAKIFFRNNQYGDKKYKKQCNYIYIDIY